MPLINASESLLLVIDAQNGFYPESRMDVDREAMDARLRVASWLCGVAQAVGVAAIVTEEDATTNGPTLASIGERLHADVQVLDKQVFGAADNPKIWDTIQSALRSTVVLVGMETDVCVAHSALGLRQRGLRPVVVHDAVFSAGRAHEYGLGRLRQEGIELLSAKEVFYDWLRDLPSVEAFGEKHPELSEPPGFSL